MEKVNLSILLIVGVLFLMSACSSSRNSVESLPRQVLLSSSERLMIAGKQLELTASLNRESLSSSPEDRQPLIVRVEIITSDGANLPAGLQTDAVWLMVDDEVWGSSYAGEQFMDDRTRIVKIARGNPDFGVGTRADVIVRIHHDGKSYLLKTTGEEITRSE